MCGLGAHGAKGLRILRFSLQTHPFHAFQFNVGLGDWRGGAGGEGGCPDFYDGDQLVLLPSAFLLGSAHRTPGSHQKSKGERKEQL